MIPALVVPAVATTAASDEGSPSASIAARSAAPVRRGSSVGAGSGSPPPVPPLVGVRGWGGCGRPLPRGRYGVPAGGGGVGAARARKPAPRPRAAGFALAPPPRAPRARRFPRRATGDKAPAGRAGQPGPVGDEAEH